MTIAGYDAEPQDVEHLFNNLCGDLLDEKDPLVRYTTLSSQQALVAALVSRISRERGRALAEMTEPEDATLETVAKATGLGKYQRVQQLIKAFRDWEVAA